MECWDRTVFLSIAQHDLWVSFTLTKPRRVKGDSAETLGRDK
jgi:hypothetical protein